MSSENNKIQQEMNILLQEYAVLQRYTEELSAYLNNINVALSEASLARKSIEELSASKESKVLVSLDRNANAFIRAEVKEKNKIVVNIGGDYYIYTTVDKALIILSEKIEELEKSRKNIQKELAEAINRIEKIKQQLAVLQEKISKAQQ